jgi:hypothetical protein
VREFSLKASINASISSDLPKPTFEGVEGGEGGASQHLEKPRKKASPGHPQHPSPTRNDYRTYREAG